MNDPAQDLQQLTQNPTPTLADVVEEVEEKQQDYQAAYNAGGHFKEQLEAIAGSWSRERTAEVVKQAEVKEAMEIPEQPEIEPEVEGYIEKVEKQFLPPGLADDYVKQVGMTPADPQNVAIHIPMTTTQIQQGLQHKVVESVRWLAVWCLRQLKILHAKS